MVEHRASHHPTSNDHDLCMRFHEFLFGREMVLGGLRMVECGSRTPELPDPSVGCRPSFPLKGEKPVAIAMTRE